MRIIVVFLSMLLGLSCGVTRKQEEMPAPPLTDTLNLSFINRYVIERTILMPIDFDFYPVLYSDDSPIEIEYLDNEKYGHYLSSSSGWCGDFLKDKNIQRVIDNTFIERVALIFDKYPLKKAESEEAFYDQLRKNALLFLLGDVYCSDNRYYLPIIYLHKLEEFDDFYETSMIYEFEIFPSGIPNFLNIHEVFGYVEDGNLHCFRTPINEVNCNQEGL